MVRQRSLRRQRSRLSTVSVAKPRDALRANRTVRCLWLRANRTVRRRRSLRKLHFGAETTQSLVKAFTEIAAKDPRAAASILHIGLTTFLQYCGFRESGAIEEKECPTNNVKATRELHEFLEEWDKNGLSPVQRAKFGADPLDIQSIKKAAKEMLEQQKRKQKEADAAYKAAKAAYKKNKSIHVKEVKKLYV